MKFEAWSKRGGVRYFCFKIYILQWELFSEPDSTKRVLVAPKAVLDIILNTALRSKRKGNFQVLAGVIHHRTWSDLTVLIFSFFAYRLNLFSCFLGSKTFSYIARTYIAAITKIS